MVTPPFLKPDDEVVLIAPAKRFQKQELEKPIEILTSWGLKVRLGKNIFSSDNLFAGTDIERTEDLQNALNDPLIKAVFCIRGGYGTSRIIDHIDFKKYIISPKWVIGFSDITVLLSHINTFNIESLHGLMPILFDKISYRSSLLQLRKVLFGENLHYEIPGDKNNILGKAEGNLVGGNLTILHTLISTSSFCNLQGKILFIEDVGEYLYHIDRVMVHFKRAGLLKELKGILVGHFSELKDGEVPFGKSIYEIIKAAVEEYKYPVCFGFPAGHQAPNMPLLLGREVNLNISDTDSTITFNPVTLIS